MTKASSISPKSAKVKVADAILPLFTMTHPTASGTRNVNYCPSCTGSDAEQYVCEVIGDISPGDFELGQILVLNRETQFSSPADPDAVEQQIVASNVQCTDVGGTTWRINMNSSARVPGFLGSAGADKQNYIAAVAYFNETSGSGPCPTPRIVILPRQWTATAAQCPRSSADISLKASPSIVDKSTRAATLAPETKSHVSGVKPTSATGGWLRYRLKLEKFLASQWQLFKPRNGGPLRAEEIAVYVSDIEWKPSPTRPFVIRQPLGRLDMCDHDLVNGAQIPIRFTGLPKFGVVIHQGDSEHRTAIAAQSRAHSDSVFLKATRDVFVGVNDNVRSMADNEGKIELWVRVVR